MNKIRSNEIILQHCKSCSSVMKCFVIVFVDCSYFCLREFNEKFLCSDIQFTIIWFKFGSAMVKSNQMFINHTTNKHNFQIKVISESPDYHFARTISVVMNEIDV
jgi:hypothetical protein